MTSRSCILLLDSFFISCIPTSFSRHWLSTLRSVQCWAKVVKMGDFLYLPPILMKPNESDKACLIKPTKMTNARKYFFRSCFWNTEKGVTKSLTAVQETFSRWEDVAGGSWRLSRSVWAVTSPTASCCVCSDVCCRRQLSLSVAQFVLLPKGHCPADFLFYYSSNRPWKTI